MGWGKIFPKLMGVALARDDGRWIVGGEANACSRKFRWARKWRQRGGMAANGSRGNGAVIAGAAI
jgi:hypothetical protein